jgi:alkylated DNA repair dioxygenase AlkB
MVDVQWQPTLLAALDVGEPVFDAEFAAADHRELAGGAWVDVVPGWCTGHDELFERVLRAGGWSQRSMRMYGEVVDQPRLATTWASRDLPVGLGVLHEAVETLSQHYRVPLDRVTANLYRDGRDGVAWHGDSELRDRDRSVVAVLSLGAARSLRLRPRDGGASLQLSPTGGDLLVMGGTCQRTWRHTVPKVARPVGPRIAVMFRHDPDVAPLG